jgi:hypothetical protein
MTHLYEWMEDFDWNDSPVRVQLLEEAVQEYNQDNGTSFNTRTAVSNYFSWLKDKVYE